MGARRLFGLLLASAALVFAASAAAKEFEPGDLRLCNAKSCVEITDQTTLDALSAFYYGRRPRRTRPPALRAPYYELRFENGYATGIVATSALDRFLSYGVNLQQFSRGRWYRVPAAAVAELRRLGASVAPLRLTRAAMRKSR